MDISDENRVIRQELRDDPIIKNLLERMPDEVKESFSEAQLSHLKVALGARSWGKHAVDFRSTVKFFRYRYYYVFVAGRNRREMSRKEKQISLLIQSAILTGFIGISTLFGLLLLYLLKSALGIDLFSGFSLGIWDWFKETFLN